MSINSIKSCSGQTALPCHPDMDAPLPFGCCECQGEQHDSISKSAINDIHGRTEVQKRLLGFTGIRAGEKIPTPMGQTFTNPRFRFQRNHFLYYRLFEGVNVTGYTPLYKRVYIYMFKNKTSVAEALHDVAKCYRCYTTV